MFKLIIKDFKKYYSNFINWLFETKHNYIFRRVVENTEHKRKWPGKQIFAILNSDKQFEYISRTDLNRRKKALEIKPDLKLRIVTFYKTPDDVEKVNTKG